MGIFDKMAEKGHEQIIFNYDKESGLKAIIAFHDTTLGPCMGGVRMMNYASEEDALRDCLRLSHAMTYKCGIIGENRGGAKAVIIGDPEKDKNEKLLRAFGRLVQSLNGKFVTGVDIGLTLDDAVVIHKETDYIVARPESDGSWGKSGDTAGYGVWKCMKACAKEVYGNPSLKNKKIAVQGAGYLGESLIEHLAKEGPKLIVADIDKNAVREMTEKYRDKCEITAVEPNKIYDTECDIFAPCAIGGILNDNTIPRLKCKIVAGGANNQLDAPKRHAQMLKDRGILYAPDYIINAGGVIQAICEIDGKTREDALRKTGKLHDLLLDIFARAKKENKLSIEIADEIVNERLRKAERK